MGPINLIESLTMNIELRSLYSDQLERALKEGPVDVAVVKQRVEKLLRHTSSSADWDAATAILAPYLGYTD